MAHVRGFTRGNTSMGVVPTHSQSMDITWLSPIPSASFATVLADPGATTYATALGCGSGSPGRRGSDRTGSPGDGLKLADLVQVFQPPSGRWRQRG
ncbi:hypothetical protein EV138_5629 [Kribbella voronezhensis]|uniref:Uncharacterized protein n=1 Tax=Kribbella voronezhensis TaxID=2512212 RepID=A0A4R7SXM6_9ACTN|nr:hypothetical protein EV138_5629 [Kribbella voronezhensis]